VEVLEDIELAEELAVSVLAELGNFGLLRLMCQSGICRPTRGSRTYGVLFHDLLLLGLPDMLYHGEPVLEAVIALLDGLGVTVAQELLAGAVLGHLLVQGGFLEQLVEGAVGNLLNCRLDQLPNGQEDLLQLLDALVGGLDLDVLVDLVAAPAARGDFLLGGLGDLGGLGAGPSAASSASAAGGASGCGGSLGDGHVLRNGVVHLRGAKGREAVLAHDVIVVVAVGRVEGRRGVVGVECVSGSMCGFYLQTTIRDFHAEGPRPR
jgi:hypothetical protein